jgi:N-methylhydantoinase A/oxoprolinase/acetone carboxylase beta subunit
VARERGSTLDGERVEAAAGRLRAEAEELRGRDRSVEDWSLHLSADLRYAGQISGYMTLPFEVNGGGVTGALNHLVEGFGDEHEREFGYRLPGNLGEVEIVNLRASLIGSVDKPAEPVFTSTGATARSTGMVRFFNEPEPVETTYIERDEIAPGEVVRGPLVITEWDSTILVPPHTTVRVGDAGDLILTFDR